MTFLTSSQFASASAAGTDWRDTAKAVLEKLEVARTEGYAFNFGILYISDHLAGEAGNILNLFKSVLQIENWIGGVAIGVCGGGEAYIDRPAISAMIGRFGTDDVCVFPSMAGDMALVSKALGAWLERQQPVLGLVHGDPLMQQDHGQVLKALADYAGAFFVGGLTSSRGAQAQFADKVVKGGFSGAVFSSSVRVATCLSQGCREIGAVHTITRADGGEIAELDSARALEVFEGDLRAMAIKKIDRDPDEIMVDEDDIPEEYRELFKGEIHAALPVSESDQKDYLVRHITAIDQEEGTITIAEDVFAGGRIVFVHRDEASVYEDLSRSLLTLRERVLRDEGVFAPKGALYVSCVARAAGELEGGLHSEMRLIREIIGEVPMTGFYAAGEIHSGRLYGYTGILTLFL